MSLENDTHHFLLDMEMGSLLSSGTDRETDEQKEERERLERVKWVEDLCYKEYHEQNIQAYRSGTLLVTDIPLGADVKLCGIGKKSEIDAVVRAEIPHLNRCCLDLHRDGQDYVETVFVLKSHSEIENLLHYPWLVRIQYCTMRAYLC